jgi:DNA invertase Pin-like site-specific DNA recombinase
MDMLLGEEVQTHALIRAGLYLRISRDRARLRLAVRRQEADCRQVAERLGWSVECVYIDNGLSASQFATKPRDDYKRLLGDIREGRLDAVVVWMEDRSHRQVIELAEFVKTCQAAGISRYASVGTEYDLSDPDQVTMLFSIARMSETEARRMSIRVKRSLKELAGAGQYHGGPKPYGYEGPIKDENGVVANRARIGKAIVDEEAMIIREAARRILNGESLRSVVIDLNRRGIPAPRGALWTRRTLKVILTHPRVAGLRQHQGVVVGKALWPAILDHDTWERVRLVLLAAGRGYARPTSRNYLLTGFIYCGKCGKRLAGMPYPNGTRAYGCYIGTTYRGCGGVRRKAEPVETLIREAIFSRLDNPKLLRMLQATDDEGVYELRTLYEQLRDDTTALDELADDYYVKRVIAKRQFLKSRQALEDRIEVTRYTLAELEPGRFRTAADLTMMAAAENVQRAWESASQDWRRELIEALIERIVVLPQATSTFNPVSIQVTWRAEEPGPSELHQRVVG